jgi:hypothetical protein
MTNFDPQKTKRIAISAFLVFHIVAITCWCAPLDSALLTRFRALIRPYMQWSGLLQGWNMFAPEPTKFNSYMEADVIFQDGQKRTWAFPRMEKLGYWKRYRKERYRKFANENLRMDANSALWPDAALRIARLNRNAANPPVMVILVRCWSQIPPPRPDGSYRPGAWYRSPFYLYAVRPGDLK